MAAFHMAHWRTKPGRAADFMELAREFIPIGERLGAKTQRMVRPVGNPNPPATITWAAEFEDMVALAKWIESNDPEVAAWAAKTVDVADNVGSSIAVDVPY